MMQNNLQDHRFMQLVQRFSRLANARVLLSPSVSAGDNQQMGNGVIYNLANDTHNLATVAIRPEVLELHGVVTNSSSTELLENLAWLSEVQHIAYVYKRCHYGYRLLFSDGIFCDLYIYESQDKAPHTKESSLNSDSQQHTLNSASEGNPHENGYTLIWKHNQYKGDIQHVIAEQLPALDRKECLSCIDEDGVVGELLTNIIIGLRHYARGNKYQGYNQIQHIALRHLITLSEGFAQRANHSLTENNTTIASTHIEGVHKESVHIGESLATKAVARATTTKPHTHQAASPVTVDLSVSESMATPVSTLQSAPQNVHQASEPTTAHTQIQAHYARHTTEPHAQNEFLVTRFNIETALPGFAQALPTFAAGYSKTPEAALAMLNFIDDKITINHFIKDQILNLVKVCQSGV